MKKNIVLGAAAVLILTVIFTSYSFFQRSPQEVVDEGVSHFAGQEKLSSSLTLKGVITPPSPEKPSKVEFELDVSGKSDVSDKKKPKVDMKFVMNVTADSARSSRELLLRLLEGKTYVNLIKIDLPAAPGQSPDAPADAATGNQFAGALNKWWVMPEEGKNIFSSVSEEQQKLQQMLKGTRFFVNAVEEAKELVEGVETTRYRVELDKKALANFIADIMSTKELALSPEEEQAIEDSLKDVEWSGAVWIGEDDSLHRIKGTVFVQPAQGPVSSFDVDYRAWNFGEEVAVSAPESSQEFNTLNILPLLGGLNMFTDPNPSASQNSQGDLQAPDLSSQ